MSCNSTIFREPEDLVEAPCDSATKEWLFKQLKKHGDDIMQVRVELAEKEIEIRQTLQNFVTEIEERIDSKKKKSSDHSFNSFWETTKDFILKHHRLLLQMDAKPETLEWIFRLLEREADQKNTLLIESIEQNQLIARQATCRADIDTVLANDGSRNDFYETPAFMRNRPFAIKTDPEQNLIVISGGFEHIWRSIPSLIKVFHLPVYDDEKDNDAIALKSGMPIRAGVEHNLTFVFDPEIGLKIHVHQNDMFDDVVQGCTFAIDEIKNKYPDEYSKKTV